jgi:SHS2 domain-containing protein
MGRWETFDHTADLGLRIRGDDLEDLFRTAAEALTNVIVSNQDQVRSEVYEGVGMEAASLEELLVDWLNDLVYRCEVEHEVYGKFEVSLDLARVRPRLSAFIEGESIDPARHVLDHEVKAVTRHGLKIVHDQGGWLAEVVVDI